MDEAFKEVYVLKSKRYSKRLALLKDEILNDYVEEIFERYKMTPEDCAKLNSCITIMAVKQMARQNGGVLRGS